MQAKKYSRPGPRREHSEEVAEEETLRREGGVDGGEGGLGGINFVFVRSFVRSFVRNIMVGAWGLLDLW